MVTGVWHVKVAKVSGGVAMKAVTKDAHEICLQLNIAADCRVADVKVVNLEAHAQKVCRNLADLVDNLTNDRIQRWKDEPGQFEKVGVLQTSLLVRIDDGEIEIGLEHRLRTKDARARDGEVETNRQLGEVTIHAHARLIQKRQPVTALPQMSWGSQHRRSVTHRGRDKCHRVEKLGVNVGANPHGSEVCVFRDGRNDGCAASSVSRDEDEDA